MYESMCFLEPADRAIYYSARAGVVGGTIGIPVWQNPVNREVPALPSLLLGCSSKL